MTPPPAPPPAGPWGPGEETTTWLGRLVIKTATSSPPVLPAGVCYYDLIIEQDDDSKHVLLAGTVTVEQGVTTWQS